MELRQLEHFLAVAEERSFTRAAYRCHIVQSGLSASIRALEDELGARLFIRNSRTLTLTHEGTALLPEARRALGAVQAGVEAVAAVQGLERGTLVIGASKIMPPPFDLATLLQKFHREHPGIRLRLRQDASTQVFRALRNGTMDIAISGALGVPIPGATMTVIARSPMVLVCAKGHRLAGASAVSIADLADESFVDMSKEWSSRQIIEGAFHREGIARRVNFEVNDPSCLLALVERDLGVAIVPAMVEKLKAKVRSIPIEPPLRDWELVSAYMGDEPPNPAARAFLAMLSASSG